MGRKGAALALTRRNPRPRCIGCKKSKNGQCGTSHCRAHKCIVNKLMSSKEVAAALGALFDADDESGRFIYVFLLLKQQDVGVCMPYETVEDYILNKQEARPEGRAIITRMLAADPPNVHARALPRPQCPPRAGSQPLPRYESDAGSLYSEATNFGRGDGMRPGTASGPALPSRDDPLGPWGCRGVDGTFQAAPNPGTSLSWGRVQGSFQTASHPGTTGGQQHGSLQAPAVPSMGYAAPQHPFLAAADPGAGTDTPGRAWSAASLPPPVPKDLRGRDPVASLRRKDATFVRCNSAGVPLSRSVLLSGLGTPPVPANAGRAHTSAGEHTGSSHLLPNHTPSWPNPRPSSLIPPSTSRRDDGPQEPFMRASATSGFRTYDPRRHGGARQEAATRSQSGIYRSTTPSSATGSTAGLAQDHQSVEAGAPARAGPSGKGGLAAGTAPRVHIRVQAGQIMANPVIHIAPTHHPAVLRAMGRPSDAALGSPSRQGGPAVLGRKRSALGFLMEGPSQQSQGSAARETAPLKKRRTRHAPARAHFE